ncbi:Tetraspanin containing [Sigmodon hispidus]
MVEPLQEVPDGSSNQENPDQSPNNKKTHVEGGAGQVPPKGSEHAGVGSSEQTGDKAPNQITNAGSGQPEQRASEEASWATDRRSSQQFDHRSSDQPGRRTSDSPDQQLPSPLEGKASEKIDDRVSLPSGGKASEQTDQGTWEHADQTTLDQADYRASGKSQRQVNNQADFPVEDDPYQHRFSEDIERDYDRIEHGTEKPADYRSYYKTLAQTENRSLSEIDDSKVIKEADFQVQPCTFEDSQTDLRSKVSTAGETESTTTLQTFNLPDTEFTSDSQSSYEKLPSITTKVYYTSSQDKFQTTEITTDIHAELEQRKGSQRHSQSYRRRFPPIIFEDPYQVALRYMEKHNILQIFQQITENLVYEKPDDPLDFMLGQSSKKEENGQDTSHVVTQTLYTKASRADESAGVLIRQEVNIQCGNLSVIMAQKSGGGGTDAELAL